MARVFRQEEEMFLGHRTNYWGPSWDYEGRRCLVVRPRDGSPARQWSVECAVCGKTLTYRVYSAAHTRFRYMRRLVLGLVALACMPLGITASLLALGVGNLGMALVFGFIVAGIMTGVLAMYAAGIETGLVGHGATSLTIQRHRLSIVREMTADA